MSQPFPLPGAPWPNEWRYRLLYFSCTVLALSFGSPLLAVAMGVPYLWFCRWPATPFRRGLRATGLVLCSALTGLCLAGLPVIAGIPVAVAGLLVLAGVLGLALLDGLARYLLTRSPGLAFTRGL